MVYCRKMFLSGIRGAKGRKARQRLEVDQRSVRRVLGEAAMRLPGATTDNARLMDRRDTMVEALAARLEEEDVAFAWQLRDLEREDWKEFGASAGMRTAVRAELVSSGAIHAKTWGRIETTPRSQAGIRVAPLDATGCGGAVPTGNARGAPEEPTADATQKSTSGESRFTPFQQRFLLRPSGTTGQVPRSLGALGACFLGTMLVVPVEEQQQLYLAG